MFKYFGISLLIKPEVLIHTVNGATQQNQVHWEP